MFFDSKAEYFHSLESVKAKYDALSEDDKIYIQESSLVEIKRTNTDSRQKTQGQRP
jgi:hypothetical protein